MNQERDLRISEAATIIDRHSNTLRNLEKRGIITPGRDINNHRVYSLVEILKLKKILSARGSIQIEG